MIRQAGALFRFFSWYISGIVRQEEVFRYPSASSRQDKARRRVLRIPLLPGSGKPRQKEGFQTSFGIIQNGWRTLKTPLESSPDTALVSLVKSKLLSAIQPSLRTRILNAGFSRGTRCGTCRDSPGTYRDPPVLHHRRCAHHGSVHHCDHRAAPLPQGLFLRYWQRRDNVDKPVIFLIFPAAPGSPGNAAWFQDTVPVPCREIGFFFVMER